MWTGEARLIPSNLCLLGSASWDEKDEKDEWSGEWRGGGWRRRAPERMQKS